MFITMNLGNVAEPKPVSAGRYDITISEAKFRESKPDIEVSIGIDGHLDAPNIRHFISLPKKDDDAGKIAFKQLMLKRFLVQFGIPFNDTEGFSVEDFAGANCSATIGLSEPVLTEGQEKGVIQQDIGAIYNRLQLDKLHDEPVQQVSKQRKA